MITVLVVDDSALMRREISRMLESDPDIEVIGIARDGSEVLKKVEMLKPDVITLDIEMRTMNGMEALEQVMAKAPCPVIMVSSMTTEGAETTIQALEKGAFDFVHKPSGGISLDIETQTQTLIEKVKAAVGARPLHLQRHTRLLKTVDACPVAPVVATTMPGTMDAAGIVGVGISTGGPQTLMELLPELSSELNVSLLVVQHMPEKFTASLAKRLNQVCAMKVKEAEDGEIVERSTIYIAPGGKHMTLVARSPQLRFIKIISKSLKDINCPSVNVLFHSLSDTLQQNWLGVVLTGMGSDGAEALLRLRNMGGHTIVESEETCTLFGMPKRAIENGAAEFILPSYKIPEKIEELYRQQLF